MTDWCPEHKRLFAADDPTEVDTLRALVLSLTTDRDTLREEREFLLRRVGELEAAAKSHAVRDTATIGQLHAKIAELEARLAVPLESEMEYTVECLRHIDAAWAADAADQFERLARRVQELEKPQGWGGPGPQGEG